MNNKDWSRALRLRLRAWRDKPVETEDPSAADKRREFAAEALAYREELRREGRSR